MRSFFSQVPAPVLALFAAVVMAPGQAFEIGSVQNQGTAIYRGQTFVPSTTGVAMSPALVLSDFPPKATAGKAYLYEIVLRVPPGGNGPGTIHLFDQLPTAAEASTGSGAIASANLRTCRGSSDGIGDACDYEFEPTELDFAGLVFAAFSECAQFIASNAPGSDDYPAGQPLVDSDCGQPADGIIDTLSGTDDAAFIARFLNPHPHLVADFAAGNAGVSSIAGAAPLVGPDLNATTTAQIDNQTVTVHPMQGGVELQSAAPANNYTVAMLLQLDDVSGASKLLDFAGGQSDVGIYVVDSGVEFRSSVTGFNSGPGQFPANTWQQFVFDQNQSFVTAVVDDRLQFQMIDDLDDTLGPTLRLFSDDIVSAGTESTAGAWARILVFSPLGSLQQPEKLHLTPITGSDPFENDNLPSRADLGQDGTAGHLRNFHTSTDEDWLYLGRRCDIPNAWSQAGTEVMLLVSDDARFEPIVEVYPQSALAASSPTPSATYGACGSSSPLQLPALDDSFLRIRNCPSVPIAEQLPVNYHIEVMFTDSVVCSPAVLISGTVAEAGTGSPVGGVFILGSDNSAGFSSPGDGSYAILVTDFGEMTLNVISPLWEAQPTVVPTSMPGFGITLDLEVTRKGSIFSDQFEDRPDPFSP